MKTYKIADITFATEGSALGKALESASGFSFFETTSPRADFRIVDSDSISIPDKKTLYAVDVETGHLENGVDSDGNRWFSISTEAGELSFKASLQTDEVLISGVMRPDMLKSALWNAYGMMTASRGRVAIHSSCVSAGGKAYLFLGESGTGKSTHSRLWLESIPGAELLNDDSPILRVTADGITVYGSPWSGKTPCYRDIRVPLGGIVRLHQSKENKILLLSKMFALAALHPSFPPGLSSDNELYAHLGKTLSAILTSTPVYSLGCLPDHEAALLSHSTLTQ